MPITLFRLDKHKGRGRGPGSYTLGIFQTKQYLSYKIDERTTLLFGKSLSGDGAGQPEQFLPHSGKILAGGDGF